MQAVVYEKYGGPDVLEIKEVDTPAPADNEILIKVLAATLHRPTNAREQGTMSMGLLNYAKVN